MIRRRRGKRASSPGGTIVEATSGNTGAGLALVAAIKRLQVRLRHARQDVAGEDRQPARVRRPVVDLPDRGRARRSAQLLPGRASASPTRRRTAFYANQYHNPANPEAHYLSTGPGDLGADAGHELDVFVAGMGTGGTISGIGKYLKEKKPDIKIVGVDPVGSLYYDFVKTRPHHQAVHATRSRASARTSSRRR